ncbi:MAG: hypothetical protein H6845_01930 [Alphaproteobacteria bacterium]|nr:MAG: hypothetical protein H6845_01930 [Alphaproteobacteria bacterium]
MNILLFEDVYQEALYAQRKSAEESVSICSTEYLFNVTFNVIARRFNDDGYEVFLFRQLTNFLFGLLKDYEVKEISLILGLNKFSYKSLHQDEYGVRFEEIWKKHKNFISCNDLARFKNMVLDVDDRIRTRVIDQIYNAKQYIGYLDQMICYPDTNFRDKNIHRSSLDDSFFANLVQKTHIASLDSKLFSYLEKYKAVNDLTFSTNKMCCNYAKLPNLIYVDYNKGDHNILYKKHTISNIFHNHNDIEIFSVDVLKDLSKTSMYLSTKLNMKQINYSNKVYLFKYIKRVLINSLIDINLSFNVLDDFYLSKIDKNNIKNKAKTLFDKILKICSDRYIVISQTYMFKYDQYCFNVKYDLLSKDAKVIVKFLNLPYISKPYIINLGNLYTNVYVYQLAQFLYDYRWSDLTVVFVTSTNVVSFNLSEIDFCKLEQNLKVQIQEYFYGNKESTNGKLIDVERSYDYLD